MPRFLLNETNQSVNLKIGIGILTDDEIQSLHQKAIDNGYKEGLYVFQLSMSEAFDK